jgi:TM2 domain-containing membrane protein YozV
MTEPQFGGNEYGSQPTPPPPPQPGYPQQPGYPPPYPPPAGQYPGAYMDPSAPYGRHPLTGEPLSDKSKTVAGLLQLLGIVGILGIGRFYTGQTGLGVAQLLIGLFFGFGIGWLTCGLTWLVPLIWGIVDCVSLMNGDPRDSFGRPLRHGT